MATAPEIARDPSRRAAPPTSPLSALQDPRLIARPYPAYAALRSTHPVLRAPLPAEGAGVWLLTRHADVEHVLRSPAFSVDRRRAQVIRENAGPLPPALLQEGGLRSMLVMDPPDHTRIRKLVNKAFTPRRVAALRPRIEAIVDELLASVAEREGFDVIHDLAAPLPAIVIAELLGVPAEDHRRFKDWSSQLVRFLGHPRPDEVMDEFRAAMETLLAYLGSIIAARRREPRDDLISAMIQAQEESDALTDAELLATANLVLVAGHETTTNLIGNGTRALLVNRGELERLRAEPGLLKSAVEELLRYDSPVQATVRVPLEAVEVDGREIPADALVIASIGAANHDPAVFERPGHLDLGRTPNPHLSFGFGAHFCLGAPLARLEAEVAFGALFERFPELELTGEKLRYRPNPILRGLEALPVRVGPRPV